VNPDAPVLVVVAEILFNRLLHAGQRDGETGTRERTAHRSLSVSPSLRLSVTASTSSNVHAGRAGFCKRLVRRHGRVP
jgi:hypothetical protein